MFFAAVPGLVVHMEDGKRETNILLPRSRYQQVCKALAQSNDNVLSLAASFSPAADAHLPFFSSYRFYCNYHQCITLYFDSDWSQFCCIQWCLEEF